MAEIIVYWIDTNIMLRFLAGEPSAQAAAAKKLFSRAAAGEVVLDVSPVIILETYHTLVSFYKVERKVAAEKLTLLLQQPGMKVREEKQVFSTLRFLQTNNVGFADAYLVAGAMTENRPIASFDRDFNKFKGIIRYEPVA